MGCIILLAVNHAHLEEMRHHDFNQVEKFISVSDVYPKRFDSGKNRGWDNVPHFQSNIPGMVVSHYFDHEDRLPLVVTSDFIVSPTILNASRNSRIYSVADLEADISRMLKHKKLEMAFDLETYRSPVKGDKVSLFCLYLDHMNGLSKNPHVMEDIVRYCETGDCESRTFSPPNVIGFTALGTLNEDQDALVFPKGYHFDVAPIYKREFRFSQAEDALLDASFTKSQSLSDLKNPSTFGEIINDTLAASFTDGFESSQLDGARLFSNIVRRELLAGASYRVQPINRKKKTTA
jgi:hypothetical protein